MFIESLKSAFSSEPDLARRKYLKAGALTAGAVAAGAGLPRIVDADSLSPVEIKRQELETKYGISIDDTQQQYSKRQLPYPFNPHISTAWKDYELDNLDLLLNQVPHQLLQPGPAILPKEAQGNMGFRVEPYNEQQMYGFGGTTVYASRIGYPQHEWYWGIAFNTQFFIPARIGAATDESDQQFLSSRFEGLIHELSHLRDWENLSKPHRNLEKILGGGWYEVSDAFIAKAHAMINSLVSKYSGRQKAVFSPEDSEMYSFLDRVLYSRRAVDNTNYETEFVGSTLAGTWAQGLPTFERVTEDFFGRDTALALKEYTQEEIFGGAVFETAPFPAPQRWRFT